MVVAVIMTLVVVVVMVVSVVKAMVEVCNHGSSIGVALGW